MLECTLQFLWGGGQYGDVVRKEKGADGDSEGRDSGDIAARLEDLKSQLKNLDLDMVNYEKQKVALGAKIEKMVDNIKGSKT